MKNSYRIAIAWLGLTVTGLGSFTWASLGGSSDGTGNFFTATEQQVVDAVPDALLKLDTVLMDFPKAAGAAQNFGKMLPEDLGFVASEEYFAAGVNLFDPNPPGSSTPYRNVEFRKVGPCDGPDGATGAGSISHKNGRVVLCLSMQKLTSIPSDYLVDEIAILLAHEFSHAVGKNENTAQKVQTWFAAYSKVRLDVAAFASFAKRAVPGPGWIFQRRLAQLAYAPASVLCKSSSWGDEVVDVDRQMADLRPKMTYFNVHWPDVNQSEYWARQILPVMQLACDKDAKANELQKAFSNLKTEYEDFIRQFGTILPWEVYR